MISLLPSSPPAETFGAYALLAIIADPKAAKARLDELVAQAKDNADVLAKANNASAKAAADQAAAGDSLAKANDIASTNQATATELAKRGQELDGRFANLNEREARLASDSSAKEAELKDREAAVATREAAAKQLADKAESDANVAAILRAEYDRKLNALKSLAS